MVKSRSVCLQDLPGAVLHRLSHVRIQECVFFCVFRKLRGSNILPQQILPMHGKVTQHTEQARLESFLMCQVCVGVGVVLWGRTFKYDFPTPPTATF